MTSKLCRHLTATTLAEMNWALKSLLISYLHLCITCISASFLPASSDLINAKDAETKIASIGQTIMQAARPRVLLTPLQVGLSVPLRHHYASPFLKIHCISMAFAARALKFERNAVLSIGTDIPNFSSQFVQYVADNVGHNTATLYGKETFHGMGMIAAITPGTKKSNLVCASILYDDNSRMIGILESAT